MEEFFTHLAENPKVPAAFIVVQHMPPDHKSLLCDLMRKFTKLEVCEAEDGMEVTPPVIYVAPSNQDITMCRGRLHLSEISKAQGLHLPIDSFFRSLAEDQKDRSICIVLSGSGTDGTLGVKAIKGEGGMAMVQDPDSAEHKSMPLSAIATGMVDYILSPGEMPESLTSYIDHAFGRGHRMIISPIPKDNESLQKILTLLHTQTGHDLSGYKLSTITRRLERCLAINLIKNLDQYFRYLQKNPLEIRALFQDLLVGVTRFFRDTEAFDVIQETVVPHLFAGKDKSHSIRVWVPGCSTGEEAYSLAIILHEHLEKSKNPLQIKIFATDIDSRAIEYARNGIYPANIASDVPPERLKRHFTRVLEGNSYCVNNTIRKMVIFAEQSVTGDPPFSSIDLISCRNLLIYLDRDLQSKVLHLFNYALKPNGFLFLGTSETAGDFEDYYNVIDRKWKIYQSKGNAGIYQTLKNYSAPYIKKNPLSINGSQQRKKTSIREIVENTLLRDYTPACVITNNHGDILYFHGRTGKFLEPAQGDASINILQMARKGLKVELATAFRKINVQKQASRFQGLRVSGNGQTSTINLTVKPVNEGSCELIMVVFESVVLPEAVSSPDEVAATSQNKIDEKLAVIELELKNKEEYLQTVIEELETSNEELQSTNEEFQSTNEELETSKEELQSINEELMTVNAELQQKIDELTQANNDLNNLLAGTGVATIFIDHNLCIQRFTPTATQIINLITSDVGRPVSHIASNLTNYAGLAEDVQAVLDTLIPKEIEVQSKNGNWYLMRILPYRTLNNSIEGAVVNFIDITELKRVQNRLAELSRMPAMP